jgi:hypothetical protein
VAVVRVLAVALDLGGDQDEVDGFGAVDEVSQSEPGRGDFWLGEVLGAQPALGDLAKPGLGEARSDEGVLGVTQSRRGWSWQVEG